MGNNLSNYNTFYEQTQADTPLCRRGRPGEHACGAYGAGNGGALPRPVLRTP